MNLHSLIEIASFEPNSITPPNSWCGHLAFSAWLVQSFAPAILVELGTYTGNSYLSFCQAISQYHLDTKCYAVDTWRGDEHAGQYGQEIFDQISRYNEQHYSHFSRLLRMTFDDAVEYFTDGSINLLHIDGLHTYQAVRHDFETWLPKLAPGAVVLFHDINVRERGFGVWKLWEELQAEYPANFEFIHSHGLGVLQLDGGPDAKRLEWLRLGPAEKQVLQRYFSSLGTRQLQRCDLIERELALAGLKQTLAERDAEIVDLSRSLTKMTHSPRFLAKQLLRTVRDRLLAKIAHRH